MSTKITPLARCLPKWYNNTCYLFANIAVDLRLGAAAQVASLRTSVLAYGGSFLF
nr:MAG TPA: hypothetical protein [Caudoviricetes sp.]